MPTGERLPEPPRDVVVWLIYSRAGLYRRTRRGYAQPRMRPDEHAFRVVLPSGTPGDRRVIRVRAERVSA